MITLDDILMMLDSRGAWRESLMLPNVPVLTDDGE